MARTELFDRLRLLAKSVRTDLRSERVASPGTISRRTVLRGAMASVGALASLSSTAARAAQKVAPRIAIVGGGMAGLACAYRLQQAGVRASVYEASTRTGGRVFTARGLFPEGQTTELGGEFIDSGHAHMHELADELEIELVDLSEAAASGLRATLWQVDGKLVDESVIEAQFRAVAPIMAALAEAADDQSDSYDESVYEELNHSSLADWLDENLAEQPELRRVLASAYTGEYGLEPEEQSALNLLWLIGSDDASSFRIFGASDQRYRALGGNALFHERLVARLTQPIECDTRLVRASGSAGRGYELTFLRAGRPLTVRADLVVFALPFSILRDVDLRGLSLSRDKRRVISELGYGTNAKVIGGFRRPLWRDPYASTGSLISDARFGETWDSSLLQPGKRAILTNFLGGQAGVASGRTSADRWLRELVLPELEPVFPGVTRAYVAGSAVRMHWPSYPYTRGSYACYRPGQWDFYGLEGAPEQQRTLHFCGEHTSLDNQGYMEGAVETGELTAAAILERLELRAAARHAAMVRYARVLPQPALGESVAPRSCLSRRRSKEPSL